MSQELIFDRNLLVKRRSHKADSLHKADFLIKRSLADIEEKLNEMDRIFPNILNLGCRNGYGTDFLKDRQGTQEVIETDISPKLLDKSKGFNKVIVDEEYIPFADDQFDLIISILNLHNVNDLPGCFIQLKRTLKPNGVLIASMFGERNLANLREELLKIELDIHAGVSPRVMPCVEMKQLGALLQRAGFAMPVIDKDCVEVQYKSSIALLHDLQDMGETNIMLNRSKKYLGKNFWQNLSITKANFEILTLMAVK